MGFAPNSPPIDPTSIDAPSARSTVRGPSQLAAMVAILAMVLALLPGTLPAWSAPSVDADKSSWDIDTSFVTGASTAVTIRATLLDSENNPVTGLTAAAFGVDLEVIGAVFGRTLGWEGNLDGIDGVRLFLRDASGVAG